MADNKYRLKKFFYCCQELPYSLNKRTKKPLTSQKMTIRRNIVCSLTIFLLIFSVASGCPDGSISWQSKCYSFFNVTTEFADAELSCVNAGGHLASIHDGFLNALLARK